MGIGALWLVGCQCNTNLQYRILADRGTTTVARFAEDGFQTGERIRFSLKSNHDCYVYLLNKGTTQAYHILLPHPEIRAGDNRVTANQETVVPDATPQTATVLRAGYAFDTTTGSEIMTIVASRNRIPELDSFGAGARVPIADMDRVLNELKTRSGSNRAEVRRHGSTRSVELNMSGPEDCSAVIMETVTIRHEQRTAPGPH